MLQDAHVDVARVALKASEEGRDSPLGALDELAERLTVEHQQAGDVVAPVVVPGLMADPVDLTRVRIRQLADVEQAEESVVAARRCALGRHQPFSAFIMLSG